MDVVLSFIVVAHNHEKCIARCLDSILAQSLRVSYEIIVGDDNSSDRTWTIIEEYGAKYPDTIIIYRVNSNDCNPITLSDRASYNRGHAYNLLRGKYYAEVDGDDFLLPGDTYQKQVDLLESHPDCWLCMQNILSLPDGADLLKAQTYRPKDRFENGQIISANDYILHPDWFAQHQSYVYRRNKTISPIDSLGLDYEDTTATLFHLQFGSIICLNQSGYVWVNYGNGINGSLHGDDRMVRVALLEIEHMQFFPQFAIVILKAALPKLIHVLKVTVERKLDISYETRKSFSRYKGFIFRYYEKEEHNKVEAFRIRAIRCILLMTKKFNMTSTGWLKLAKRMML